MSRFADLGKDKNTILMRLLESQIICKALKYGEPDFLDKPDVEDPSELLYINIFPHHFIPETTEERKTFITMNFGNYRPVGSSFKSGIVRINIFTHQELHKTNYGVLRCDLIAHEIDNAFNDKYGLGMFKSKFHEMNDLYVNNKFNGLYIAYKLHELN